VVTAGEDGIARVWDADSGRLLVTLRGHTGWVYSAAFNPRGDRVVTAGEDGTTRVWDADSGRLLVTLRGHTGWVYSAVFSPDGNKIVTASEDKTARISGFELCCPFEVLLISARYIRDLTEKERERYLYQVRQRPEEVDPGSIGIPALYI